MTLYKFNLKVHHLITLLILLLSLGKQLSLQAYALEEKCGSKFYPVDEAEKDPSFLKFREQLLQAIQTHDSKIIISILDPKILNDFGGASGVTAFQKKWNPTQANSKLWGELNSILMLGGSFETDENQQIQFIAPYVFSRWCISMDCEGCDYAAIIDKEAKLRAKPNPAAAIVANLNYDIVKIEGNSEGNWVHVTTLNRQKGYVPVKSIRRPIDYRAFFSKSQGQWKMTALVSGD